MANRAARRKAAKLAKVEAFDNFAPAEILGKLRPAGLVDLEKTTLGWILIFNRPQQAGQIQRALLGSFGASLDYFRDISSSTRSLFRNHRDDLDYGEGEAAKDWQAS